MELQEKFEEETGKQAVYGGEPTKAYKKWLEGQKKEGKKRYMEYRNNRKYVVEASNAKEASEEINKLINKKR